MLESTSLGTTGGSAWGQMPQVWGQAGLHPQGIENRRVQSTGLGKVQEQQMTG